MAVLKPRNRIFLIRLTQEEYDALKTVSIDRGARTLSDFARSMLLEKLRQDDRGEDVLAGVRQTLTGLQRTVDHMAERIEEMSQTREALREVKKA